MSTTRLVGRTEIRSAASPQTFRHTTCEAMSRFRQRVGIYKGDFSLRVDVLPLADMPWEEFVRTFSPHTAGASVDSRGATGPTVRPDVPGASELVGRTPGAVMWHLTNFGTLYWSWLGTSGLSGVYATDPEGNSVLPRIWVPLAPNAQVGDVAIGLERALDQLRGLPPELKGCVPKHEMAAVIREDFALLHELVAAHGSFAEATIPDALAVIDEVAWYASTGNESRAGFRTSEYAFAIELLTS